MRVPASVSRAAGAAAILVGGAVLAGWALELGALKSVLPGLATMKPNTALGVLLAGASLALSQPGPVAPRLRRLGQLGALAVALLGLLTLGEHLTGWDLGLDGLLLGAPAGAPGTPPALRMGFTTALSVLLVGGALLLLDVETDRGARPAPLLALAAGLIALWTLAGYLYSAVSPGGIVSYTEMALHAAAAFAVLSTGILCTRSDRGLMAVVTSGSLGGTVARRLLPAAVVVPILLGWLRLEGEQAGLYGTELGLALFATSNVVVLAALIWHTSALLHRVDAAHQGAMAALRTSEALLAGILDYADDAIISVDERERIILFNRGAQKTFQYAADEVLGQPLDVLLPPPLVEAYGQYSRAFATAPETARRMGERREVSCRRKDGTEFPAEATISTLVQGGQLTFTAILRDITERKRAEAAIGALTEALEQRVRDRTAELEAANRELEAFSYSVSHDLRAPLRAIDGFSRILLTEHTDALPPDARRYLEMVRDSTRQMGRLVDDLLQFARVGRQSVRAEPVQPADLVRQALEELRYEQEGRRVEVVLGELPACQADFVLLRQVWLNLLANALKFTRRREVAEIAVGSRSQGGETVYFVRDNGVGFDMRYAGKLFGVFQRLHRAEEYEGTGVGLAIVQRIVHRHGGRVWAEAEPDRGATFYFTLGGGTRP